jgi:hypothetical protein
VSRRHYLADVIRLYLAQPQAPPRASRDDWAAAQDLYARGVDLTDLGHAVRLATLRRLTAATPCQPVRCLAYYRHVLDRLGPDELDPAYIDYVARRYADLISADARFDRQNRALSDRR